MSLELNVGVGIAVLALIILFVYYFYNVVRSYGGEIKKAFVKLSSGIASIMASVIIMGIIIRLDMLCGQETSASIMFAALLPALVGTALILMGARGLTMAAKG